MSNTPNGQDLRLPREVYDQNIFKYIMPRLYKPTPLAEPIIALEVFDGPYKGVVFAFKTFSMGKPDEHTPDGMVPVRFETKVYERPEHFKQDDEFDAFTREVLLVWLYFMQNHGLDTVIKLPADETVN